MQNMVLWHRLKPRLSPSYLQNVEPNICPDRAVVRVRFLVRKHVEQADGSVSFQAALLAEDQQGTGAADL